MIEESRMLLIAENSLERFDVSVGLLIRLRKLGANFKWIQFQNAKQIHFQQYPRSRDRGALG